MNKVGEILTSFFIVPREEIYFKIQNTSGANTLGEISLDM